MFFSEDALQQAAQMVLAAAANQQKSKEEKKLLKIKEACEIASVSRWTIARWLQLKDDEGNYIIRWHKIGNAKKGRIRIDNASFTAFLDSMMVKPNAEEEAK